MQKNLKASANQLLVSYTPYVMVMLVLVSPIELMLKENSGKGFTAYTTWIEEKLSTFSVGYAKAVFLFPNSFVNFLCG